MSTSRKTTASSSSSESDLDGLLGKISSGFGLAALTPYPAAVGSIPGVLLFFLFRSYSPAVQIILLFIATLVATSLADRVFRKNKNIDPEHIIIDEAMGMWVALFMIWRTDIAVIIAAFILFRLFDYLKSFPINVFETLPGGVGLVTDDIAAGMMANFFLRIILLAGILS